MHLISHFCSGVCVGSLLSTICFRNSRKQPAVIPLAVGLGAILPDLDGITIFFSHRIYYSSLWYSHHGISHTLFGSLLIVICLFVITTVVMICFNKNSYNSLLSVYTLLYLGCLLHIAEDMPCPPGPWHGFMLLWPVSEQRFGAWSHIGWIDEFLMVIFLVGVLFTCILSLMMTENNCRRIVQPGILIFEVNLMVVMLALLFIFMSRYQNPSQWEEYQSKILGESLYSCINWLNKIIEPIWSHEIF